MESSQRHLPPFPFLPPVTNTSSHSVSISQDQHLQPSSHTLCADDGRTQKLISNINQRLAFAGSHHFSVWSGKAQGKGHQGWDNNPEEVNPPAYFPLPFSSPSPMGLWTPTYRSPPPLTKPGFLLYLSSRMCWAVLKLSQ